jgi:hypothetical protein
VPVEIIYTSVERGLVPGTRGLTIVASSRGASKGLTEQLRGLSVYKHLYSPDHAQASLNPVVYSHSTLRIGAETFHVLSRIGDAGLDYSGRTNLLAHHVALEPNELGRHNPAALMATPGFFREKWSGEPAWLPPKAMPHSDSETFKKCANWARLGDAGWAGVLAEKVLNRDRSDVYLVIEPKTLTLPLMIEAAQLLPENLRRGATFCTYFTNALQGMDCRWRCVLSNSDEANAARRIPGSLVIDLTKPVGQAPDNAFAEIARSGEGTAQVTPPRQSGSPTGPAPPRRVPADWDVPKPAISSSPARTPPPRSLHKPVQQFNVPWRIIGAASIALMVIVAGASAATWYTRLLSERQETNWDDLENAVTDLEQRIKEPQGVLKSLLDNDDVKEYLHEDGETPKLLQSGSVTKFVSEQRKFLDSLSSTDTDQNTGNGNGKTPDRPEHQQQDQIEARLTAVSVAKLLNGEPLKKDGPTLIEVEAVIGKLRSTGDALNSELEDLQKKVEDFGSFTSRSKGGIRTTDEAQAILERLKELHNELMTKSLLKADAALAKLRKLWGEFHHEPDNIKRLEVIAKRLRDHIDVDKKSDVASASPKDRNHSSGSKDAKKGSVPNTPPQVDSADRRGESFNITREERELARGNEILNAPITLATFTGDIPGTLRISIEPPPNASKFEVTPDASEANSWRIKDAANVIATLSFEEGALKLRWDNRINNGLASAAGSLLDRMIVLRSDSLVSRLPVAAPTHGRCPQFSKDVSQIEVLLPAFGKIQFQLKGTGVAPLAGASDSGINRESGGEVFLHLAPNLPECPIHPVPKVIGRLVLSPSEDAKTDRYGRKYFTISTSVFLEQEGLGRTNPAEWFDSQFEQLKDDTDTTTAPDPAAPPPRTKRTIRMKLREWRDRLEAELPKLQFSFEINADVSSEGSAAEPFLVYTSDSSKSR